MQNIVLVGPMGAGKSTIGRGLAGLLRRPFFDTDQEIQRRTGVDIPTIFEFEGEAGFRKRETAMLESLLQQEGAVIATGGGIVERPENRERLRDQFVIYLRVPVEEQFRRTRRNRKRPLIAEAADPKARLQELFEARDPLYQEIASLTLEGKGRRVRDAVKGVCSALQVQRPDLCQPRSDAGSN
ncbi:MULTISPECIES: shikimate kinase [unclassified Thioalkalivibrio]|uniref:shikimate kinase n=1 Tax=unclassified Thioalkalivibrio TaxID=2621013 RepID=UPI0003A446CE|nr:MULTISPECIES: shikimate kinase [unclassified Thioalkalivibrio]